MKTLFVLMLIIFSTNSFSASTETLLKFDNFSFKDDDSCNAEVPDQSSKQLNILITKLQQCLQILNDRDNFQVTNFLVNQLDGVVIDDPNNTSKYPSVRVPDSCNCGHQLYQLLKSVNTRTHNRKTNINNIIQIITTHPNFKEMI